MNINRRNEEKAGCLIVLIILAFCLLIAFIGDLILTKIIIWVADGLFSCDWSDKFWQVFWGIIVISLLFRGNISIGKD